MRASVAFGLPVVGVVLGLAGLLLGEAFHGLEALVPVGGVVVLAAVGLMTAGIAALPEPEHGAGDGHGDHG